MPIKTNLMKQFIKKHAPLAVKRLLFSLQLHRKVPVLRGLSQGDVKIDSQPIVILSMPRSGSSWLGSVIGVHSDVRYLREPVTTAYMLGEKGRVSVFSPKKHNAEEYKIYIQRALSGVPASSVRVTPYLQQWSNVQSPKKLLIKEVNPLALEMYIEKNCRLVYLARHPYSIASSYSALSWRSDRLIESKFSKGELLLMLGYYGSLLQESYNFQQGFLFAWIEVHVQSLLSSQHITVRYEDICIAPEEKISTLLKDLNLQPLDKNIENVLKQSLSGSDQVIGKFCLARNANQIGQIKITENNYGQYCEVMSGYDKAYECLRDKFEMPIYPLYNRSEAFIKRVKT